MEEMPVLSPVEPTSNRADKDKIYETDPLLSSNKGLFKEIGSAGIWTVSSFKSNRGPEKLRDDNLDSYWQTDSEPPHTINILFRKKTLITDLCIFLCHDKDDTFTPASLSLRCGNTFSDLQEVDLLELKEPNGWVIVPIRSRDRKNLLKTFLLQIVVVNNHQSGRDSRIRQIKVHTLDFTAYGLMPFPHFPLNFSTPEFMKFSVLR